MKRWVYRPHEAAAAEQIRSDHQVSPLLARLLAQRGVGDIGGFLKPGLSALHDPYRMLGMQPAVERIRAAVANHERILVYGDYDVDGTTSVVLLKTAIELLGGVAAFHVPHRVREGYGMRSEFVERAAHEKVRLLISVDTGIRDGEVVEHARGLGIDTIITDHHLPDDEIPKALAVLNPNQPDCSYPDKHLCGVGVTFKLIQALLGASSWEDSRREKVLGSMLKIVAIGTIADMVPLVGENRVFARIGLEGLQRPVTPGLKALLNVAGLLNKPKITAGDVGFRIAPRINAAGRMDSATDIVTLLTTRSQNEAEEIAQRLDGLNSDRQRTESDVVEAILERLGQLPSADVVPFIVVEGEGWHPGVIGIVASRIVERFYRPTLVLSVDPASGLATGSARSISAFDMFEGLDSVSEIFERFGGHKQAAGCTIRAERVPALRDALNDYAANALGADDFIQSLNLDADLPFGEITDDTMEELGQLQPYGLGNPTPVFSAPDVVVKAEPKVIKERHLKLRVEHGDHTFSAIAWRMAEQGADIGIGAHLDTAFTVEPDTYWGGWQLNLKDFRRSNLHS